MMTAEKGKEMKITRTIEYEEIMVVKEDTTTVIDKVIAGLNDKKTRALISNTYPGFLAYKRTGKTFSLKYAMNLSDFIAMAEIVKEDNENG